MTKKKKEPSLKELIATARKNMYSAEKAKRAKWEDKLNKLMSKYEQN